MPAMLVIQQTLQV